MSNKIALFDLDDSLAGYSESLKKTLCNLDNRPEFSSEDMDVWQLAQQYPFIRARIALIKSQPSFWLNLPLIPNGFTVMNLAKAIGYEIHILTKGPKKFPSAWEEKVLWCQKHIEDDIDIHITSNKSMVYGKILYDDFPDYMETWLKHRPRGLGIMPETRYNKDYTHPNVIKWNGENLNQVKSALVDLYSS
jgi:5'(3')-deoxyribonucleotidase